MKSIDARRGFAVKALLVGAIAGISWTAPLPGVSTAAAVELKYGTFLPSRHPIAGIMRQTSEALEVMTEGRVSVKVYDSGTLAKSTGQLDAVQRGVMDFGRYIWTYSSLKQRPFFVIGSIPFLYRDGAGYVDAWTKESTLMDMANQHAEKYGYDNVIFLAPNYTGFARFGLRNRVARVPADLKGLKIRGTGTYIAIIKSYGAAGVTIGTPQVYGALERGLIDGAVGLDVNWINFKWGEPATYLVDYKLAPVGSAITLSKATWNKLSARDRELVRIYADMQAAAMTNLYLRQEINGNNIIRKNMEIYTPTPEERKLWDAPRGDLVEEWVKVVGEDVGRKAIAVVAKYNR